MDDHGVRAGAPMRRRQRRLRSWWRHEQQTVAAVLVTHHSHSKVGTANDAPRGQETVTSTRVGARPGSVTDPRPQVRVQRHTVDQMVDAPLLPTFDVPVPLMVEQLLLGVLSLFDFRVAEQVTEVPKILLDGVPERTAVRVTQLAEQLVEVPTPVSCLEQIADIPVPGRGGSGCLLGFPPEQGTTSLHVSQERISERIVEQIGAGGDFPSRRAGPRVVLPRQGSAAAGAEQIADIVSSGGPHGFLPGQFSTTSPGPVHVDEHLPDSAEWVQLRDEATSKVYFWNRRTRATKWKPPPGIRVVWVGEKGSGGEVW